MLGYSRYRHQGWPVLQKHLSLTHITPDPERRQVHSQVVRLSLKETYSQSLKGLVTVHHGGKLMRRRAKAGRYISVRRFYLCVQGAVIREGLSTANIWAVILQSRDTVLDTILQRLNPRLYLSHYLLICLSKIA